MLEAAGHPSRGQQGLVPARLFLLQEAAVRSGAARSGRVHSTDRERQLNTGTGAGRKL